MLDRLESISGADAAHAELEKDLHGVLTRAASGLFKPEELPRYLQIQLENAGEGVPSWRNLTGERLTYLGLAHHTGGIRADECGTLIPTSVPVTIDYAALVEEHEVCSSAAYDPGITTASFEDGVHRTVMTAPDLTVTRSVFPHALMNLPFVQVSFNLRNTSDQFHDVTLVLLFKPFDEEGLTGIARFSFTQDNLILMNGRRVAFAHERPSAMAAAVYDSHTGRMISADARKEVVSSAGLMQLQLSFDRQLEPGGSTDITFFFFVDPDSFPRHEDLALLLSQNPDILEQEHRLMMTKEQSPWYRTGDDRLNRFAANQLLHLSALESTAATAFSGELDPITLPVLVQAYDRIGETEASSEFLRSYAARLTPDAPLTPDTLFACASLTIALGWHLKVARQVQLRRQLFPLVDQFILRLSHEPVAVGPLAVSLLGPLRRSSSFLYLILGKAIESYQGMLSEKDELRFKRCDDFQLRLLKQMDGTGSTTIDPVPGTDFTDMALVAAYALYGVHSTEDAVLVKSMNWITDHWQSDGLIENPYAGSLADLRLSLLFAKALILQQNSSSLALMEQGFSHFGVSDALPDYLDLRTDRALLGSRHSVVATALAVEWLSSLIFVERGTYLSIAPASSPSLFAGNGIDVHGLLSTFGELSVRMQRHEEKVHFVLHSDFLRGVSAIELNFPWELKELVARKGAVKYVTGGTIVMEPADYLEGEAIVANPGPS